MTIEHHPLEYKDSDGNVYEGVVAYPKSTSANNKLPGILVFHAFGGCGEFEIERAKKMAEEGFVALAADVYGKGKRGKTVEENFALLKPLIAERNGVLKRNVLASLNALKSVEGVDQEKIGAMGYCFGGLCALDLARYNVGLRAASSFHGTLTPLPDAPLEHFDTVIQVHHGAADSHVNAQVDGFSKEMIERKAYWSLTSYPDAMHGFTEPHIGKLGRADLKYNEYADKTSWAATVQLFKNHVVQKQLYV